MVYSAGMTQHKPSKRTSQEPHGNADKIPNGGKKIFPKPIERIPERVEKYKIELKEQL